MNSRLVQVSLTQFAELRPPKNGRASLSLDNDSASAIKFEFDTLPSDTNGATLQPGINVEWSENTATVPQGILNVRGSVASLQTITIMETPREGARRAETRRDSLWNWFN